MTSPDAWNRRLTWQNDCPAMLFSSQLFAFICVTRVSRTLTSTSAKFAAQQCHRFALFFAGTFHGLGTLT